MNHSGAKHAAKEVLQKGEVCVTFVGKLQPLKSLTSGESEGLNATEGVLARPAKHTTDIDADVAVAEGTEVGLRTRDVRSELLFEEGAQLLNGEHLDVKGA